jgi:hypothetical protein
VYSVPLCDKWQRTTLDQIDIDGFLTVCSEGPCVPAEANCNEIDFNNGGCLFDLLDIENCVRVFSEMSCL